MTEELKRLCEMYQICLVANVADVSENYEMIKKALEENERLKTSYLENLLNEESKEYIYKKLEALEIIKKKNVNVGDFVRCKSVEDYNNYCCYNEKEQLTQEEYYLLKEMLS